MIRVPPVYEGDGSLYERLWGHYAPSRMRAKNNPARGLSAYRAGSKYDVNIRLVLPDVNRSVD